jgi:hypothetical protein
MSPVTVTAAADTVSWSLAPAAVNSRLPSVFVPVPEYSESALLKVSDVDAVSVPALLTFPLTVTAPVLNAAPDAIFRADTVPPVARVSVPLLTVTDPRVPAGRVTVSAAALPVTVTEGDEVYMAADAVMFPLPVASVFAR